MMRMMRRQERGNRRRRRIRTTRRLPSSFSINAIRLFSGVVLVLVLLPVAEAYELKIRVCQNKFCSKRATNLQRGSVKNSDVVQTLHNLLGHATINPKDDKHAVAAAGVTVVHIESSGCLAKCELGPNVEITASDTTTTAQEGRTTTTTTILNGMTDAQTMAFQLNQLTATRTTTAAALPLPKVLIAASKVLEQTAGMERTAYDTKLVFLSSVITKLDATTAAATGDYAHTSVQAHAHALRAQVYFDQARALATATATETLTADSRAAIASAIQDAQCVTVGPLSAPGIATATSRAVGYRVWADAELFLSHHAQHEEHTRFQDHTTKAVDILSHWYQAQPKYRTKLAKEIQHLQTTQTHTHTQPHP